MFLNIEVEGSPNEIASVFKVIDIFRTASPFLRVQINTVGIPEY